MVENSDACSVNANAKMNRLLPYNVPSWAANLKGVPKYFIKVRILFSKVEGEISGCEI